MGIQRWQKYNANVANLVCEKLESTYKWNVLFRSLDLLLGKDNFAE